MGKRIDPDRIGQRVLEARNASGLNQTELATETGIERSALNKIEKGARRVSAFELSEIARVLGRRMDWFVTEPTAAIVSHRERYGTSTRTIDIELERFAQDVEFLQDLSGLLALPEFDAIDTPGAADDAETMATELRRRLQIDPADPVVDISDEAQKIGLLIFSLALGKDAADGATILLERGGVALVNSTSDVGRRRLTAAHELGHFIIADEYAVDDTVIDSESAKESLLDRFARAFLMPSQGIMSMWQTSLDDGHDVRSTGLRVASRFRVDFATLSRRLLDLGIGSEDDRYVVRTAHASRLDFVDLNLHVPTDLEATTFPRDYELAVFRAYKAEKISSERALDLLRNAYGDEDLPSRPTRSEGETWQILS